MASASTERMLAGSRVDVVPTDTGAWNDEKLLDRFLGGGEPASEGAFTVLVSRHGPMVLGVCQHILGQAPEAEDAFQATFLVLARNAAGIRDRRVLGRWLYEVAYRIAIRSKASATRRRAVEKEAALMSAVDDRPVIDPAWNELMPVLHEEVNRLPEKYRSAVVLCYLEGRTNEEAASLLRWPVGTVKGRLSRARDLLRSRLTRRGLALSAAFLAARLSNDTVFADVVPSRLAEETARTAAAVARRDKDGQAGIPPRILELADGIRAATALPNLRVLTLAAVLIAAAVFLWFLRIASAANGGDLVPGESTAAFALRFLTNSADPPACHALVDPSGPERPGGGKRQVRISRCDGPEP